MSNMNSEISIECEDIILREYRSTDLDRIYSITQEPEINKNLPDWDVPKDQRKIWLQDYELPENKEFSKAISNGGKIEDLRLRLAIISKKTGELIGWCCSGIKDEIEPPNREIMYAIANKYQNNGYATQAALGVTNYLFQNSDVSELNAIALVHNIPSNKVIQKSGFEYVAIIEIDGQTYHHYKLRKEIWKKTGYYVQEISDL
jgi:RimJ/RimL family protein N-acetyltransferase